MSLSLTKQSSFNSIIRKERSHRFIKWAIVGLLLRGPVSNFFESITLLIFGFNFSAITFFVNFLGIALFVLGAFELFIYEYKFMAGTIALFALLWLISAKCFSDNIPFLKNNLLQFFIYVLPFMWFGKFLAKNNKTIIFFLNIAKIKLMFVIVSALLGIVFPTAAVYKDYMDLANEMLIGTLSIILLAFRRKRIDEIVLAILSFLLILLYGSRGVLVCIGIFVVAMVLLNNYKKTTKVLFSLLVVAILALYYPAMLLLNSFGVDSHIVSVSSSGGSIFFDEQRLALFQGFWERIIERPFGYGVLGDRKLPSMYGFSEKESIYPHNIVLEVMVDFGYIAGSIIVVIFLISFAKAVFSSRSINQKHLLILLFCGSFIKLLVSSSFWLDQFFFMLFGSIIGALSQQKKERVYGK